MSDEHPHPLLAQLPLTVSPFLSLPTATPLPYSYKTLPSTLPPSVTENPSTMPTDASGPSQGQPSEQAGAPYVISASGHAAHPDAIIESCRALQAHLLKLEQDAKATLDKWHTDIGNRELAEKRRVAPGWLDVDSSGRGLMPDRKDPMDGTDPPPMQMQLPLRPAANPHLGSSKPGAGIPFNVSSNDEGAELDRAFGGMAAK